MPEHAFQFQYTVFLVEARMTNTHLIAKMGIKHIQVPLEQVEFIFLDDRRRLEHWELIISYRTPKGDVSALDSMPMREKQGFGTSPIPLRGVNQGASCEISLRRSL